MRQFTRFLVILAVFCGFVGSLAYADTKSYSDPEKSIVVSASEPEFAIRLNSNPTTGYSWFLKKLPRALVEIKEHSYRPPTHQIAGAGGAEVWVFNVKPEAFKAPQIFKIKLIYARPWEIKNEDDHKEAEFTVVTQK